MSHWFLLDLWADHNEYTQGFRPRLFEHPIPPNYFKYKDGKSFDITKPLFFKLADIILRSFRNNSFTKYPNNGHTIADEIIQYADNRMKMGDLRYGPILRQSLGNYDVAKEFIVRMQLARENKSLEYLVDAYNMARIQYFIDHNKSKVKERIFKVYGTYHIGKLYRNWYFTSIDDGHHSEPKKQ